MAPDAGFSLEAFYDAYPRVEEDFQRTLDVSLEPSGSELLYELVGRLRLPPGAVAIDVGCGEGRHAMALAGRFELRVHGFDPVARHVRLASERLGVEPAGRVDFALGAAEALPVAGAAADLVWCRDVLVHVADLDRAYAEFRRVLRPGGHALVYQSAFATDRLEPREAAWLYRAAGIVPSSADPARTEAAIAGSGLRIEERMEVGLEWAERAEERRGEAGRRLLHAARLLRAPDRYIGQFGQAAYDIMLADCLWHVYHLLGKLSARVYLLSFAPTR